MQPVTNTVPLLGLEGKVISLTINNQHARQINCTVLKINQTQLSKLEEKLTTKLSSPGGDLERSRF